MKEKIIVALFMIGALGTTLMMNVKLDNINNEGETEWHQKENKSLNET